MPSLQFVLEEGNEMNQIRELFREYQQALGEDLCFQSFDAEVENPLKKYDLNKGALILAYHENEVCGCIALQSLADKEEGVCEMKRLYVRPAFRKLGIGRLLVDKILEVARGEGLQKHEAGYVAKIGSRN
jgi:N-acetylglutamate synthase-like GNAT family acetyltransferase